MIDDLSAERFERNLAAFADALPELHAVLAAIDASAVRIVDQPGEPGDINLDLGGPAALWRRGATAAPDGMAEGPQCGR